MVGEDPAPGLCAECRHVRTIASARGSLFWLCLRADTDPSYARYPRLPVTACPGREPRDAQPTGTPTAAGVTAERRTTRPRSA